MEKQNKKVEVEVVEDFFDHYYGKDRKIGDVFVSNTDLALKRKSFSINGQEKPLVKILRSVPDDTPEEEKKTNLFWQEIIQKFKKEDNNDNNI